MSTIPRSRTIGAMDAVTAGNLTDAAQLEVEDANSASRKATVAQLRTRLNTGAQDFTATIKVATTVGVGAATPAASGSGVTFPATQSASTDANTLDDYEEGTWTPADGSGAALSFTSAAGTYEKIGRLVIARGTLVYPATADGSNATVSGLPFTVANADEARQGVLSYATETTAAFALPNKNTATVLFYTTAGANVTNATLSGDTVYFTTIYHI